MKKEKKEIDSELFELALRLTMAGISLKDLQRTLGILFDSITSNYNILKEMRDKEII